MDNQMSVLYVDDEPINLMLFERVFSKKYTIRTANSAFKGLDILREKPDIKVVISDMRMPEMDGLEFIQKAMLQYPNVVFFILTGFEITDEIKSALDSKLINRYFQKPFRMDEIDLAISHAMDNNNKQTH